MPPTDPENLVPWWGDLSVLAGSLLFPYPGVKRDLMVINQSLLCGTYHPSTEEQDVIADLMYAELQAKTMNRIVRTLDDPLSQAVLPLRNQFRDFVHFVCTGEISVGGTRTLIEASVNTPGANRFGEADERKEHLIAQRFFWANSSQVEPSRSQ